MEQMQSDKHAERKVTMQDIADQCGVSKTTVSLALSRHPRISKETVAKIEQLAKDMGYSAAANNAARRLALQKYGRHLINRAVAVFIDHQYPTLPYFAQIVQGIMDVLAVKGFGLFMHYIPEYTEDGEGTPLSPLFDRGDIDGIIGIHDSFGELLQVLRQNKGFGNRPSISLTNPVAGSSVVRADDRLGAYLAARHLLSLGHKDILLFTFIFAQDGRENERITGACDAFREYGLDPDQHLYTIPHYPGWLNTGGMQKIHYQRMHITPYPLDETHPFLQYLHDHPQITAILAPNDACALNAWQVLRAANISVPEQMSLVGFDDILITLDAENGKYLTTVHVPLYEIGTTAATLLLKRIFGELAEDEEITLPVELIDRGSTAPP
ncbi:MAG TPA: LacI family DNA-binding transcriptional regulator, partial [Armatimonadota bacterium]|nr:LacI family DNA-binding transcriptional regulator [Armatimonadota bacterium]